MKSKIFLVSMLAMLIFSFKPATKITNEKATDVTETIAYEIVSGEVIDDNQCTYILHLKWVGNAASNQLGYQLVRYAKKAYYESLIGPIVETNYGVDNFTWTFRIPCNKINDLTATVEQDPDICEDSECED